MANPLQPLIHDSVVVLRAPTQAWSGADGSIGSQPIHGIYFSDTRLVSHLAVLLGGHPGEGVAPVVDGPDRARFIALHRLLDDRMPDPRVLSEHSRRATTTGVSESVTLRSDLREPITTEIEVVIGVDLTAMDTVKAGLGSSADLPLPVIDGSTVSWGAESLSVRLEAAGAVISSITPHSLRVLWPVTVPARGEVVVEWTLAAADTRAVVAGVDRALGWSIPRVTASDDRLARWIDTALGDLDALRLTTVDAPDEVFLAAGAPWFFTLFGRDSLWAARMMLPLGTTLAADTLRALARLQGRSVVASTAEQPGKIMHELRRDGLEIPAEGVHLPPLYYGTVDATPLWVCVLHDAWRWGLPDDEVRPLLPHLVAALEWMRDFGDADGDGLLEYVDTTGHGLANQGWKDSGDSVQWRDGSLADGPIALVEVQGYAFEAAMHGADLLDHFDIDGGSAWRAWATRLATRFHESFWIDSAGGAYPAIALDAQKRRVDTVTSNLGHLFGTGLLDHAQSALIARRLVSPEMSSGYGLRTMSTDSEGYWPLSYHGGSVWTHDTAIAIAGLSRDGFGDEAAVLAQGLLAAAAGFDYRLPELHSGDPASSFSRPVPYPAACRPQAWSAASAVAVLAAVVGLSPDAPGGLLGVSPAASGLAPLSIDGFRFAGQPVSITLDAAGEVAAASGAPIEVR